jgi:hypothetical protein
MEYIANFNIDNKGNRLPKALKSNNLQEITHEIQGMACENRKHGETACWWVDNENGEMVDGGIYDDYGHQSMMNED